MSDDNERAPLRPYADHSKHVFNKDIPPICGGSERRCHDVPAFVILILVWCGMLIVIGFAFQQGNAARLFYGNDALGNLCGYNNKKLNNSLPDLRDKRYLMTYRRNGDNSSSYVSVCVKQCPQSTKAAVYSSGEWDCLPKYAPDNSSILDAAVKNGYCSPGRFASSSLFHRCYPLSVNDTFVRNNRTVYAAGIKGHVISMIDRGDFGQRLMADLSESWRWLLMCGFLALLLSFGWILLLQYTAGCMVWTSALLPVALCAISSSLLFVRWANLSTNFDYNSHVSSDGWNASTLLAMGIFMTMLTFILGLIIFFLRRRIALAVAVIREAAVAIKDMPQLVLLPLVSFFALGIIFTLWFATIVLLSTAGKASIISQYILYKNTQVTVYNENNALRNMQFFLLFGMLWTANFFISVIQTAIAGAVGMHYWTRTPDALPRTPVSTSIKRVFRYHLGSLAMGSFILALVQFIRLLITQMQRNLRRSDSIIMRFFASCLGCVFACAESFLKILHRNAYIKIALNGDGFFPSAKAAFWLLSRNAFRLATVDLISDFLLFLGKIFVAVTVAVFATLVIGHSENVSFFSLPIFFAAILGYLVASCFMAVYSMAIDTIFLCFCEDIERNDGSPQRPYFMRNSLRQFLNVSQELQ